MAKKRTTPNKNLQLERAKKAQMAAKKKVKELRPFMKKLRDIDLRKPLSKKQIKKIDNIFTEYQELTTRPVKIFRARNKKHLEMAQRYARHDETGPQFDVAFIPIVDPNAKLHFGKETMSIQMGNVRETVIFFDPVALARDAKKEIEKRIAQNPKSQQFVIMAGKYLFNGGITRSLIVEKTRNLMQQYNNPDDNNFWGNWLFGLVAAEYTNQKSFEDYRKKYQAAVKSIKDKKAQTRQAWLRRYGEKAYQTRKEGRKKK